MSAIACRPRLRRPPGRRRRYRKYALSRSLTFGPAVLVPFGGWLYEREPLRWAGLAVMELGGLTVIPVVVLLVLFFLPAALAGGLVPRSWRIGYRERHGRDACPCWLHRGRAPKYGHISASLRRVTYAADRYRCLYCGVPAAELAQLPPRVDKNGRRRPRCLHADHWIPVIAGGLTTFLNMGTLCDEHNMIKSCWYRSRRGRIWYNRERRNPANLAMAEQITMHIRWRRWSLFRLWRAAWALGG
jgi:hypothetical protein